MHQPRYSLASRRGARSAPASALIGVACASSVLRQARVVSVFYVMLCYLLWVF